MDLEKIKSLISNFGGIYNSFYANPPSEENNYYHWPQRFSGEERKIAEQIYDCFQRMTAGNSRICFNINPSLEKEILEKFLSNTPLQKV